MAFTEYFLDPRGHYQDEMMRRIREDCKCIKSIDVYNNPKYLSQIMRVERIDTGIWKWNEDIES